jgi:hypothetical protein
MKYLKLSVLAAALCLAACGECESKSPEEAGEQAGATTEEAADTEANATETEAADEH